MAAEPPVMLMDEPFGAVDPIVRERLQNEFLRLHRLLGMTVLFVTHDIDEAIKMGNRVAVMQQGGHLAQYAPPTELLMRPANDFVARFVGVDRGLKRLSLLHVADVPLATAPTVRVGEPVSDRSESSGNSDSSGKKHLLLLDAGDRPLGWVDLSRVDLDTTRRLDASAADPSSPIVSFDTTLRDALSMSLATAVQTAVVVDEQGRYQGVLTLDALGTAFRSAPAGQAEDGAEDGAGDQAEERLATP
jgi:osmoprotectant transport system ATP-binding protein